MADEDVAALQLQDDEELSGLQDADVGDTANSATENDIKLNIEVDMEDEEPADVALDEIDLSDLVIEDEGESSEENEVNSQAGLEEIALDSDLLDDDSDMVDLSLATEEEGSNISENEVNVSNDIGELESLSLENDNPDESDELNIDQA